MFNYFNVSIKMKTNLKLNLVIFVTILFFGISSCEDITNINVDPNHPKVSAQHLLTQAQLVLNTQLHSREYSAEWTLLLSQQWAQSFYTNESIYLIYSHRFNQLWTNIYTDVLPELKVAKELIEADANLSNAKKANQLGIIMILEAYTYHALVDGFGHIPFSKALQPYKYPFPSYDSQQDIYATLISNLQTAVASFDQNEGSFNSGDAIFNGDVAAWKRFGNSLLMRIAMRISNVDETTAKSIIAGISDELITTNDQNAIWVFGEHPDICNPLAPVHNYSFSFKVSSVVIDKLKEMNDPRLTAYAEPTDSGEYKGMPPGLTTAEAIELEPYTSDISSNLLNNTSPIVMLDAAEVHFMLAEAYQRNLLSGDAEAAYNAGISASLEYWGFTDNDTINAYLATNPYDELNWKEAIGVQKWLAFYMNGPQAWAEWRRLGQPQLEIPEAAKNDVIPVRSPYPQTEQIENPFELEKVTSNPEDMSTKLWWDVD